jgi:hypothetical protein
LLWAPASSSCGMAVEQFFLLREEGAGTQSYRSGPLTSMCGENQKTHPSKHSKGTAPEIQLRTLRAERLGHPPPYYAIAAALGGRGRAKNTDQQNTQRYFRNHGVLPFTSFWTLAASRRPTLRIAFSLISHRPIANCSFACLRDRAAKCRRRHISRPADPPLRDRHTSRPNVKASPMSLRD